MAWTRFKTPQQLNGGNMFEWFATTLRTNPEIAIFLALALGYYFGKFTCH